MFNNVLVGVAGHEAAHDAVALARQLTSSTGKLTLARIYAYHGEASIPGYDDREAAQITLARTLLKSVSDEIPGLDAQLRWTGAKSPGYGLHLLAETTNADLLVVGSTRRGRFGRVLIGDDTRAALDGAPCAVAIAPAGYAGQASRIRTVGVGYDGSPDSARALISARALAAELDAELAALKVVVFPFYTLEDPLAGDTNMVARLVDRACEEVASLGDLEPHAASGLPAEQLARWSRSLDLLIVGSRGLGPLGRLMHGSTSRELTRRAQCPLLVVPRAHQWPAEFDGARPESDFATSRP